MSLPQRLPHEQRARSNTGGATNLVHVGGDGNDIVLGITVLNGKWLIAEVIRSDLDTGDGTLPPSNPNGARLVIY